MKQLADTHRRDIEFQFSDWCTSNYIFKMVNSDMQRLVDSFTDIFKELNQLPPSKKIYHHINLKGVEPINVCPYRYAYFQKAEIEKQAHYMLKSGLIHPNIIPFSSLVLL